MMSPETESKFMQLRQSFGIMKKANDGVAAIEFALVLPILVLIFFGLVESANLLTADARLRAATAAAGDMLTQVDRVEIVLSDLTDVDLAVKEIMKPLPLTAGTLDLIGVRVTVIEPSPGASPNNDVRWSRLLPNISDNVTSKAGLTNPTCGTNMTIPTGMKPSPASTAERTDVLETTGVYIWRPWFSVVFKLPINLKTVNYNLPRYRPEMPMELANGGNCP